MGIYTKRNNIIIITKYKKWCDFVVYTNNGISVERINFDPLFWNDMILKLKSVFINSVLPKLVQQFT